MTLDWRIESVRKEDEAVVNVPTLVWCSLRANQLTMQMLKSVRGTFARSNSEV